MPVLLVALGPVSLLRTVLAGDAATAAGGAVGGCAVAVLLLRLLVGKLMLLLVLVMVEVVVRMLQPTPTSSGQTELLLLVLVMATAGVLLLLPVGASGYQHDRTVSALLQTPVLLGVRIAVTVAKILKHVTVQRRELVPYSPALAVDMLAIAQQSLLSRFHLLYLVGERHDLVQLSFAAVLGGDLVLAAPPNVPNQGQLRFAQIVLGQALVELIHRQVDDLQHGNRNLEGPGTLLVPGQVLLLGFSHFFVSRLWLWIGPTIMG